MYITKLTEEQKNIAKGIKERIEAATSILMHCHPNPDPDSLGSTLAMKFALEAIGKRVTIIGGDSPTPEVFMHFPGAPTILQQNYISTDLSQFDLFLILDSGSIEMISKKGEVVFPEHLRTVVIDHHASNKGYAEVNLVAVQYPSTTEVLFDLFKEWGMGLTHDIAVNLYVGLFTDTGGFRYELVSGHSFTMAAELFEYAPDVVETVKILENSGTRGNIEFLALGLSNKHIFNFKDQSKGSYVISTVTYSDIQRLGLTPNDYWNASFVTNLLRSVVGWNVVVILTEQEPGLVKASFRTRDHVLFDVSKVALKLGGGGHKAASGATFYTSVEEAMRQVSKTIEEVLG
ncbi:MAG: bifunctional oligoribonuclease/PAP phosphatase NrnA [Candidatus Taylorbacteria bacterium]|nr:bifunctional oligoribonuclease/PAP phosphatase NrnA [Candidatus Taylorbacteria bacterium]